MPFVAKTQGESRVIRDKDLLLKTHHRDLSHKRVTRAHTQMDCGEKIGQRKDATLLINYKAALPKYRLSILTHPNRSHLITYLQVTCHVGSYLPGMWGTSCHILGPPSPRRLQSPASRVPSLLGLIHVDYVRSRPGPFNTRVKTESHVI